MERRRAGGTEKTCPVGRGGIDIVFCRVKGKANLLFVGKAQADNLVWFSFIQLVKNDFEEVPLNAASMASSGTHLSPFLRFGCLSPRVMCQRLTEKYGKVGCCLGCYLQIIGPNKYSKIPRLRIWILRTC